MGSSLFSSRFLKWNFAASKFRRSEQYAAPSDRRYGRNTLWTKSAGTVSGNLAAGILLLKKCLYREVNRVQEWHLSTTITATWTHNMDDMIASLHQVRNIRFKSLWASQIIMCIRINSISVNQHTLYSILHSRFSVDYRFHNMLSRAIFWNISKIQCCQN